MPEIMASHWGLNGVANGYMPRAWALSLLPGILFIVAVLLSILPKLDPFAKNIDSFRKYYDLLVFIICAFLLYIHTITILWNYGIMFDMTKAIIPAFSLLFFIIGGILPKLKRNWFAGIRTPWTMSSDKVWEKTHVLGGKLFKIAAISALFGLFLAEYA